MERSEICCGSERRRTRNQYGWSGFGNGCQRNSPSFHPSCRVWIVFAKDGVGGRKGSSVPSANKRSQTKKSEGNFREVQCRCSAGAEAQASPSSDVLIRGWSNREKDHRFERMLPFWHLAFGIWRFRISLGVQYSTVVCARLGDQGARLLLALEIHELQRPRGVNSNGMLLLFLTAREWGAQLCYD